LIGYDVLKVDAGETFQEFQDSLTLSINSSEIRKFVIWILSIKWFDSLKMAFILRTAYMRLGNLTLIWAKKEKWKIAFLHFLSG